ncbi:MAG: DUF3244 domain-containing protein [Bacteroidales bacterium]|nr:DUF3244 domain-containing protein [Bacteroidales bacterium]
MRHTKIKQLVLLMGLLLPAAWCGANGTHINDGHSHIALKARIVQGAPKSSSIDVSIYGHTLTVVFTENLGQVDVEINTTTGESVQFTSVVTPNGLQCYILNTGDYVVTFTLSNGDEYYGEFTVTD